ncbi:hypothetical protein [Nocardia panacis]|uniref:hypothetical protein n=1 Tax=Nocardia panacis TaxID=2340916 RepID=UPI001EEFCBC3|nr:hypothetical protein [Nocardia panacis]
MNYSAALDFGAIFGPLTACPHCGSDNVAIVGGCEETTLRCEDCGERWRMGDPQVDPIAESVR